MTGVVYIGVKALPQATGSRDRCQRALRSFQKACCAEAGQAWSTLRCLLCNLQEDLA